uniref:Uncharacterized protein n=1 Tax=Panagrolaimus superbus TaxID=310955 RepID=A0A914YBK4_9BILA
MLLYRIAVDGPDPEAFDPNPTVIRWFAEGHGRVDPVRPTDQNTELIVGQVPPPERFLPNVAVDDDDNYDLEDLNDDEGDDEDEDNVFPLDDI